MASDARVTVTTSPTAVAGTAGYDAVPGSRHQITNVGSVTIYFGDSTVDTNGWPLPAGATVGVVLEKSEILYGVVAAGTSVASVLNFGL